MDRIKIGLDGSVIKESPINLDKLEFRNATIVDATLFVDQQDFIKNTLRVGLEAQVFSSKAGEKVIERVSFCPPPIDIEVPNFPRWLPKWLAKRWVRQETIYPDSMSRKVVVEPKWVWPEANMTDVLGTPYGHYLVNVEDVKS